MLLRQNSKDYRNATLLLDVAISYSCMVDACSLSAKTQSGGLFIWHKDQKMKLLQLIETSVFYIGSHVDDGIPKRCGQLSLLIAAQEDKDAYVRAELLTLQVHFS